MHSLQSNFHDDKKKKTIGVDYMDVFTLKKLIVFFIYDMYTFLYIIL